MNWSQVDLLSVPAAYRGMLHRYVEHGATPVSIWLLALLTNDLIGFLEHSPTTREHGIPDALEILRALEAAPQECWGSQPKVHRWIEGGGLRGQIRRDVRLQ
jgi:hypothetical protein